MASCVRCTYRKRDPLRSRSSRPTLSSRLTVTPRPSVTTTRHVSWVFMSDHLMNEIIATNNLECQRRAASLLVWGQIKINIETSYHLFSFVFNRTTGQTYCPIKTSDTLFFNLTSLYSFFHFFLFLYSFTVVMFFLDQRSKHLILQ